jgi:hypothetical protein
MELAYGAHQDAIVREARRRLDAQDRRWHRSQAAWGGSRVAYHVTAAVRWNSAEQAELAVRFAKMAWHDALAALGERS